MSAALLGWSWHTPLGGDEAFSRLLAGERAARPDPALEGYECRVTAPVIGAPARSRHQRFLRRMGLYGLEVAVEAMARAGVAGSPRLGLFSAVGGLRAHWNDMLPGLARQREDGRDAWELGLKTIHPFWMLRHLSNNAHALLSADVRARGEGATFGGASAGAQALAAAVRTLSAGAVDHAVVVAYDSLLDPETLVELGARGGATTASPAPPYDEGAAGFVPGEAAAALVLGPPEAGRLCLDAFAGADGAGGEPGEAALEAACTRLAASAAIVDGAGRARPSLDEEERAVLARSGAGRALLTSITAAMGRLGAATSVVQAIALARALEARRLYPIAGLRRPGRGPLEPVAAAAASEARVAFALATGAPGLVGAVRLEATGP